MSNKLQNIFQIPAELLDIQVLPGCLLTLVENALKHAFKGLTAPYIIKIHAEEYGGDLILSVADNGIGIPPDRLAHLGKAAVKSFNHGGGVALLQLQQCLTLEFGYNARLTIECPQEGGTLVRLIQPMRRIS